MRLLARHVLLLGLAFAFSWWIVFHDPPQIVPRQTRIPGEILVSLEDFSADESVPENVEQPADASEPAEASEEPEPSTAEVTDAAPAPPPPELGSPTAEEEDKPQASSPGAEDSGENATESAIAADSTSEEDAATLMADPSLLESAALEISGSGRKGFTTELIAAPEDQLEIARTFGEEVVLIPFRSVAPEVKDPFWFRIAGEGSPRVERMSGPPPLSGYRQYRDLFDYEYSQLPTSLRELRRAVLSRNEVYLFAALIPPREWALVIGRRRQALEESGRSIEEVQTFRIRYRRTPQGGFDVVVNEILFADGSRFRPTG